MIHDPVIGDCPFADGAMRLIYEDGKRQYVIEDEGYRVCGFGSFPKPNLPLIMPSGVNKQ
jgi:hypothetical protein